MTSLDLDFVRAQFPAFSIPLAGFAPSRTPAVVRMQQRYKLERSTGSKVQLY